MPNTPHERFCTASAQEKCSRVQPCASVMGSSHKPKPCRMPIDSMTMAAPQSSTWAMGKRGAWAVAGLVSADIGQM